MLLQECAAQNYPAYFDGLIWNARTMVLHVIRVLYMVHELHVHSLIPAPSVCSRFQAYVRTWVHY